MSKIRPSSVDVMLACGGSLDLPTLDIESVYAEEGTAAHACAAACLSSGVDSTDPAVQVYVKFCRDLINKHATYWIEEQRDHPRISDFGGTADFVCIYNDVLGGRVLHIVDYKHGMGQTVESDFNSQMLSYACIWLGYYPEVDLVRTTVIQPRDYHTNIEPIRTAEYTPEHVRRFESLVIDQLLDRAFRIGPHCMRCNSRSYCPAMAELIEETMEPVTVEQALRILKNKAAIKKTIDDIGHRVTQDLQTGQEIPGWKLVQPLGYREWKGSEAETLKGLRKLKVLKTDAFNKIVKLKSPSQIETLLKEREVKKSVDHLVFRPEKPIIAVPESDRRPAVAPPSFENCEEYYD